MGVEGRTMWLQFKIILEIISMFRLLRNGFLVFSLYPFNI